MKFKSYRSYWDFKNSVKNESRYILEKNSKDFLEAIKNTCITRIRIIEPSHCLWRAQVGCDYMPFYQEDENGNKIYVDDIPIPFTYSRMKPLIEYASEGRANPKGIPYLYVATDKETAMSEVRPDLDKILTVAKIKPVRKLKIVDFSVHYGKFKFYLKEPNDEEKINAVWIDLDNAFSLPLTNNNFNSDYVPTQIIAEFIKSLGYDGIAYKSSLGNGHNVTIFDLDSAKVETCSIHRVKKINYSFETIENQYTQ